MFACDVKVFWGLGVIWVPACLRR